MVENNEPSFEPQSDEALARLLEEQMRLLRGGTPTPAAAPTAAEPVVTPGFIVPEPATAPVEVPPSEPEDHSDEDALDALFGTLLDEPAQPAPTDQEPVIEPVAAVAYESLDHTQPINFVEQEQSIAEAENFENPDPISPFVAGAAVSAAVISEPAEGNLIAEEIAVEEVFVPETVSEGTPEDVHSVAERVLTEIGEDGAVYAPIPAVAAVNDPVPVPQMFGNTGEVTVQPPTSYVPQQHNEAPEPVSSQEKVSEQANKELTETFKLRMKPVSTQQYRPSFDELVFGETPAE